LHDTIWVFIARLSSSDRANCFSQRAGDLRTALVFSGADATDEECLEVLRQAAAEGLLLRADHGLDSKIGEGGVKVSGGEKQRISIARALLRRPELLVFDEATSSLDSLTEEEISQTIRDVAASRDSITILIAHRLSTVMHADCIYVVERGRVVESGGHEDLLAKKRTLQRDVATAGKRGQ
jgi:ATP-binding cassette subfamily B protein